eukprot:6191762-Ditylum_brightwellii.AAC.1
MKSSFGNQRPYIRQYANICVGGTCMALPSLTEILSLLTTVMKQWWCAIADSNGGGGEIACVAGGDVVGTVVGS